MQRSIWVIDFIEDKSSPVNGFTWDESNPINSVIWVKWMASFESKKVNDLISFEWSLVDSIVHSS